MMPNIDTLYKEDGTAIPIQDTEARNKIATLEGSVETLKESNDALSSQIANIKAKIESGEIGGSGLTSELKEAFIGFFQEIRYVSANHPNTDRLIELLSEEDTPTEPDNPDVPDEPTTPYLTHITVVANTTEYNVDTDAMALDLTVTAFYSNGESQVVTGYTISGKVVEGNNTFTVTYGTKSATVNVTGVSYYKVISGVKIWKENTDYNGTDGYKEDSTRSVMVPFYARYNFVYSVANSASNKFPVYNGEENAKIDELSSISGYTLGSYQETFRNGLGLSKWMAPVIPNTFISRSYGYDENSGKVLWAGSDTILYKVNNALEYYQTLDNNAVMNLEKNVKTIIEMGKNGYGYDTNGAEVVNARKSLSKWIDVNGATKFHLHNTVPSQNNFSVDDVWFFDENKQPISKALTNTLYYNGTRENIEIPSNAKYIRFSHYSSGFVGKWDMVTLL